MKKWKGENGMKLSDLTELDDMVLKYLKRKKQERKVKKNGETDI